MSRGDRHGGGWAATVDPRPKPSRSAAVPLTSQKLRFRTPARLYL